MLTIFEGGQAGHARGVRPEWPGNLSFAFPGNLNTIYGCRLVARCPDKLSFALQGNFDTSVAGNAFLSIFVEGNAFLCDSSHIAASGRDGPVLSLGVESGEEILATVCAVFTAGT